ncbi:hypothetical protein GCM10010347_58640 [Streptomyces cirratus]|uniref:Uncharacterized protein n=1 Tax=Streptomyces cirratus TaxID=68187 RepID=A0ABQ3F337_9ACTN|nr:hypothetical protein GCM10010347_58640 [Streptomyces cirratus]
MPEPLESPAKILSPARPVDPALVVTGGAVSSGVGVVEAMVFPVWTGASPLAAVHRIPRGGRGRVLGGGSGPDGDRTPHPGAHLFSD